MKIQCTSCAKVLVVPEERIPRDKAIVFPCPSCSSRIKIDLRDNAPAPEASSEDAGPEYLTGEALKRQIIATIGDLPPMPQTVFKAREIMSDPKAGFKELAALFEADQAIAAQILRLANSPYYGISGGVSSIQKASVVLGHKTLAELITLSGVSGLLGNRLEGYGLGAGELWKHSLAVGFGARFIAKRSDAALESDAFTAGLLHDSGKLILDRYIAERWQQFEDALADADTSFLEAEKAVLSLNHAEIASEVCKAWHIPQAVGRAICYHHHPSQSQGDKLAYIVHAADAVALMSGLGMGVDGTLYRMEADTMDFLNLHEDDLGEIMGQVLSAVSKIMQA